MPDEIKNDEGTDFSHFYDNSSVQIQKELVMAKNTLAEKTNQSKRTRIIVLVSIFAVLSILEIGLLWYSTLSKSAAKKPANIPGYEYVTPTNGIPHYRPIKK